MPIIAVAGALIAGAVAAPAIGGLIAGAGITLGGALEVTAAVGATLGAVGAVTRDKGLQTAGLVIGGIGGIGSIASAAGLIDGSTQLFGDASTAAAAAAPAANEAAATVDNLAGGLPPDVAQAMDLPAGAGTQDIVGSIANENGDLVAPTGAVDNAAATPAAGLAQTTAATEGQASAIAPNPASAINGTGLINQASGANAATGTGIINQANAVPPSPATVPQAAQAAGGGVSVQSTGEASFDAASKAWQPGAQGFPTPGYLDGIVNFAQKSPLATYGLIQAGGSLVGGMFSPMTPAQVALANAQAANNRAAAGLTSQQTANIQSGVPTVTRIPQQVQQTVTGAPMGAGLINQPRTAVTGVPA